MNALILTLWSPIIAGSPSRIPILHLGRTKEERKMMQNPNILITTHERFNLVNKFVFTDKI